MPSVSFDSRTLSIDGRRIWIVSGSIHMQRVPREQWRHRIHQAKLAGLNTIETPLFWNLIEPRPGSFDFNDNNDVAHFLRLCEEFGLHAILRPGPFVGAGWDLGGLPSWLLNLPELELRTANQPFLEAVGRYFNALAKQVKNLQASSKSGGSLIMIQNESQWDCDDPETAPKYLGELARYMREAGFTVPRINSNNLWQGVEGEIDGWSGEGDMFATMRQLRTVRPGQPTIVIDYGPLRAPILGQDAPDSIDGLELQRQLGEILSAGGQFNLANFCTGTSFGFWGGQSGIEEPSTFAPTHNLASLVDEHGRASEAMGPVRRLLSFTSSFSRVFANAEPAQPPVVIDPAVDESMIQGHIVNQLGGSQGSVLFVFSPPKAKPGSMNLLLSDGSSLPVQLGKQRIHWFLMDVTLSPKHTLDYTSLCALTSNDQHLVVFGAPGSIGEVSINASPLVVEVPKGRKPVSMMHEGICVTVVSDETADETFLVGDKVYVGASSVDAEGEPLPSRHTKTTAVVHPDAKVKSMTPKPSDRDPGSRLPKLKLGDWEVAHTDAYVDGSSPRYAVIPGPADLSELGTPYGYGWYQATIKSGSNHKAKIHAPQSADRAQLFVDGEPVGILGSGPGAERVLPVQLKKGDHTVTALVDNMGRVSSGSVMNEKKGLYGHLLHETSFKVGRSSVVTCDPIDVLGFKTPVFGVREGDTTHHSRLQWSFKHLKKSSIFLEIPPVDARIVVVLNDEPIMLLGANRRRVVELDDEATKRGNNVLELAFHVDALSADLADERVSSILETLTKEIIFTEEAEPLTDKGEWSFAKWEPPSDADFDLVTSARITKVGAPTWWRTTFEVPAQDLAISLDTSGLSKGMVYVNGRALGRYFGSTQTGKSVPPALELAIPRSWLKEDAMNELLIFDEHGASPSKAKLNTERV